MSYVVVLNYEDRVVYVRTVKGEKSEDIEEQLSEEFDINNIEWMETEELNVTTERREIV